MNRSMYAFKFAAGAIVILLMLCASGCQSEPSPDVPTVPAQAPQAFNNSDWAAFLSAVVTPDGYVRWDMVQSNDNGVRRLLMNYIGLINAVSPDNHPDLFPSSKDRLAYWLNACNAMCIYAVIKNSYPPNVYTTSWPGSMFSQDQYTFGGDSMTLNQVVQKPLESFDDPRIFFALNFCAASCAPLRAVPFDGAILDAQLEDQGQRYLSDPRAAIRDGDAVKLNDLLAKMHEYDFLAGFKRTFGVAPTGLLQALQPYVQSDSPIVGATSVEDLGFDWRLNRPPR